MSREPRSEFARDVLARNDLLDFVLRSHLHMERWLDELLRRAAVRTGKTYDPEKHRFSRKITACEAQMLIPRDLADLIRQVNDIRNNYAHVRRYKPSRADIARLQRAFRELERPFYVPFVNPSQRNLGLALASLCGYLHRLVTVESPGRPGR